MSEERMDSLWEPKRESGWTNTRISVIRRMENGTATEMDWDYFYHKYRSLIIAIGYNKEIGKTGAWTSAARETVKELVSRVFESVYKFFTQVSAGEKEPLDLESYKFRSWFSRIIYNKYNDILRKRYAVDRREQDLPEQYSEEYDGDHPDLLENDGEAEIREIWHKFLLRQALSELQNDLDMTDFSIFFQVKMLGKKGTEIARVFDMKPNTVNQICSRNCKKLRELVAKLAQAHPLESYTDDELCRYIAEVDQTFREFEKEIPR